jgi:hypothetical protein
MADLVGVDLKENGGLRSFNTVSQLRAFAKEVQSAWVWMREASEPTGHHTKLPNRTDNLCATIEDGINQGLPLAELVAKLPEFFELHGDTVVHHESALGTDILTIRDLVSPAAATFAYSFNRGWAQFGQGNSPELTRGALAMVMPGVLGEAALIKRFGLERANYRTELRRVMVEAGAAELNRAAAAMEAFKSARSDIRRWAAKRGMRWHRYSIEQRGDTASAIAEIKAVQKTYEEAMVLQAPSKYWLDKARAHKRSETSAAWRLVIFFGIAGVGLTAAFYFTALFFLQAEADPRTSVYFVASAGLATIAGLVLWVGRLLTRLYLSEHHLRKDAEERRIMTTTYLALMRKTAAGDQDRQVILTALFRNSSDGIVKDDGAADLGLSALVSRLGVPTR